MSDRPRDDSWWLASDGKWYPPSLDPDDTVEKSHGDPQWSEEESPTTVPRLLTRMLVASLGATSVAFVAGTFVSLQFASALGDSSMPIRERESIEAASLAWSSIALLGLMMSGVILIVWTFRTSKSMDARGPIGRRWRGGWTVGSWFIPFASFVLPKFVFNEIEKTAQEPFAGVPLGETWKTQTRPYISDLWWLLWVSGLVTFQVTQVMLSDPTVDDASMAVVAVVATVAHALLAGAGVALILVVARIERVSRA